MPGISAPFIHKDLCHRKNILRYCHSNYRKLLVTGVGADDTKQVRPINMLNTFLQFSRGPPGKRWTAKGSVTTECDDLRQDRREKK